jgi:hypothetical protein
VKHLTIAIATLAVAFASLGVEATAVAFLLCLPAIVAPAGRRVAALYWVAVGYPLLVLFSLYLTWLAAWVVLGHPPRSSLDDPQLISPILIFNVVTSILLLGSPIALLAAIVLAMIRVIQGPTWKASKFPLVALIGIVPWTWVAGCILLSWDPLNVMVWYFD